MEAKEHERVEPAAKKLLWQFFEVNRQAIVVIISLFLGLFIAAIVFVWIYMVQVERATPKDAIETVAAVFTTGSVVLAAIVFVFNQYSEINQRRRETHEYFIERYREYLTLCMQYPTLEAVEKFGIADEKRPDDDQTRSDALFQYLLSIFEQAHLRYKDPFSSFRERQWKGWEEYMTHFFERPDFVKFWIRSIRESKNGPDAKIDTGYDKDFERYLNKEHSHLFADNPLEALEKKLASKKSASQGEPAGSDKGAMGH